MASSTKMASAKTLSFSPTVWVLAVATDLRKKIEGARDDDGPIGACEGERAKAGFGRIGNDLDMLEVRFGAGSKFPCGQGTGIRGLSGHERVPEHRERLEHPLRPFVREDRPDDHVLAVGEPRQQVPDAGEIVGAVPDLERVLASALQASGQRHVRRRVRVDGTAEKRLGRGDGQSELPAGREVDPRGAVLLREWLPLRLAEHHDDAGTN